VSFDARLQSFTPITQGSFVENVVPLGCPSLFCVDGKSDRIRAADSIQK
jgi:hypothetical protein